MDNVQRFEIRAETYLVFYGEHTGGKPAGCAVCEGLELAQAAEKDLEAEGYQFTEIRHAASVGEIWEVRV